MYPYCLLNQNPRIANFFGEQSLTVPTIFDFSVNNEDLWRINVDDQIGFQNSISEKLRRSGHNWGIAGYLENRESLLRNLPQMVSEKRFFHLGADIILPQNSLLYLPLDGEVIEVGYEAGKGNFGGFVLIRHDVEGSVFYSLWGHLEFISLPAKNVFLKAGTVFARLGDYSENGEWFYHTHLQVLTQKGLDSGYISKGYCTEEMLKTIDQYCPSPLFLLRTV